MLKCDFNFTEMVLRHGCHVNLLHIFRTPFPRNTSGGLFLKKALMFGDSWKKTLKDGKSTES